VRVSKIVEIIMEIRKNISCRPRLKIKLEIEQKPRQPPEIENR
jgi:hypothetical protein